MYWKKWIIASFVLFAVFIISLVIICIREDINLVSASYYKDELAYGQQMQRMQNTQSMHMQPVVKMNNRTQMEIIFKDQVMHGSATMFCPANEARDKTFQLSTDSIQRFDVSQLPAGMYKLKITWTAHGTEFYSEDIVIL